MDQLLYVCMSWAPRRDHCRPPAAADDTFSAAPAAAAPAAAATAAAAAARAIRHAHKQGNQAQAPKRVGCQRAEPTVRQRHLLFAAGVTKHPGWRLPGRLMLAKGLGTELEHVPDGQREGVRGCARLSGRSQTCHRRPNVNLDGSSEGE